MDTTNTSNNWHIYLAGEIHSDWRQAIQDGVTKHALPITLLSPVTDHAASDDVGVDILGEEDKPFWKDHKAVAINSIRIRHHIERADIVVVYFGPKYKQWNTAFDAGYAAAMGKRLITIHAAEHDHALKEIDAAASATCRTPDEAVRIFNYVIHGTL